MTEPMTDDQWSQYNRSAQELSGGEFLRVMGKNVTDEFGNGVKSSDIADVMEKIVFQNPERPCGKDKTDGFGKFHPDKIEVILSSNRLPFKISGWAQEENDIAFLVERTIPQPIIDKIISDIARLGGIDDKQIKIVIDEYGHSGIFIRR